MVEQREYIHTSDAIDTSLKLIVKSSFITFFFLFLSKLFFYLYRSIIARSFGPEIYGLFSLALIIFFFFVSFFSLGLDQGILRFIPLYKAKKKEDEVKYIFNFSFKILLFLSIFAGLILFFMSEVISVNIFNNSELVIFLKIFSLIIPFYILSNLFLAVLRANEKIIWYSFILNVFQNLVKILSLALLIFIGVKYNAVAFSYLLGVLGMFVFAFALSKFYFKEIFKSAAIGKRKKIKIRKEFFSYSWPLVFLGVLSIINWWTDSFMIGFFKTVVEVGFYNTAFPIAALMGIFPEVFMQLFFPLITKEFSKKNLFLVKELSQQVGKWIFILNLPLFILTFLFPGVLINILFGEEFLAASNALRILSVGFFLGTISIPVSSNLVSIIGKSRLLLINLVFVFVLNILLNLFLVPKYGISGAALSTTLSTIALGLILMLELRHHLSIIPLRRKIFRIFFISLLPTAFLLILRSFVSINWLSLILLLSFFILSYVLLLFITRCLDKNDFTVINSIIRKIFKKR